MAIRTRGVPGLVTGFVYLPFVTQIRQSQLASVDNLRRVFSMRPWLAALVLLCTAALFPARVLAQAYGLTQRPGAAPYLNGVMPAQAPAIGADWSTTVAFPNLTFQDPMGLVQMPGQNRLVVWEREGRVYWFTKAATTSAKTLMIDVSSQCQGWDDSGLMNIAFHPKFDLSGAPGTNRYVFIYYTYVLPVAQGARNSGDGVVRHR